MKKVLILASLFLATQSQAQKKTTYFENGKKSFEGDFSFGLFNQNIRDFYNFDTATDSRRANSMSMSFRGMDREAQPQKIYDGKCTFYYDNGKVSYSGEYRQGIKTGLFSYNYYDGSKEAELNYENGMADGKWQGWHKNGKTRFEQQYVGISEAEIDSMLAKKMRATIY
jgi:antitoxin component YwqK of YwqJK toxin-antitoxin module